MNQKLVNLLSREVWVAQNLFDRWTAENEAAVAGGQAIPHSLDDKDKLELVLLRAQIEREREVSDGEAD